MDVDAPTAPAWETLDALVHRRMLPSGRRWFLVIDDDRVAGLVTLGDVAAVPQSDWPTTRVSAVMKPADRIVRVAPDTELVSALRAMDDGEVAQAPVMDGGRLSGVLCRERVLRQVRLRTELRLPPATEAA
jgi:CBS domain-containing protein